MIKIRFFNDVRKMYSTYFSFIRVSKLFTRSTIVSGLSPSKHNPFDNKAYCRIQNKDDNPVATQPRRYPTVANLRNRNTGAWLPKPKRPEPPPTMPNAYWPNPSKSSRRDGSSKTVRPQSHNACPPKKSPPDNAHAIRTKSPVPDRPIQTKKSLLGFPPITSKRPFPYGRAGKSYLYAWRTEPLLSNALRKISGGVNSNTILRRPHPHHTKRRS